MKFNIHVYCRRGISVRPLWPVIFLPLRVRAPSSDIRAMTLCTAYTARSRRPWPVGRASYALRFGLDRAKTIQYRRIHRVQRLAARATRESQLSSVYLVYKINCISGVHCTHYRYKSTTADTVINYVALVGINKFFTVQCDIPLQHYTPILLFLIHILFIYRFFSNPTSCLYKLSYVIYIFGLEQILIIRHILYL